MSVVSKTKLLQKLSKKAYREAYAEESVKTSLPFQIKAMREQRNWSQIILGKKSEMKQNAISRLESAEYGNLNMNTLIRLANAFDCGLLVKFVPFSRLVREFEDVSPNLLEVDNFEDDFHNLQSWSAGVDILDDEIIEEKGLSNSTSGAGRFFVDSINITPVRKITKLELNEETRKTITAELLSNSYQTRMEVGRGLYKRFLQDESEPAFYSTPQYQDLTDTQAS